MKRSIFVICVLIICAVLITMTSSITNDVVNIPENEHDVFDEQKVLSGDEAARKEAYFNALKDLYYNYTLPDGSKLYYEEVELSDYYDMTQNQFAIYDLDFDGKDELIIALTNPPMAAMRAIIYDFDDATNALVEKFVAFPAINFYDNGVLEGLWSHNQGLAGDALWPYTLHKYNKESDSYEVIAIVDAWDKSLKDTDYEGNAFPSEIDADGDGIIYYIMPEGKYELKNLVDYKEYNEWREMYISSETLELEIPYMNFAEEQIDFEKYKLSKEYELDSSGYDNFFNIALINNNYELNIINDTYEFESDGNKYILECKPINDNRHLELFINGNKADIPGYTIKGVAVIDLDSNDNSKELVIRESQDGFWKNVIYKLNSNNELDSSTRFTAGEGGIYQINNKFIFPISLLASRTSPVIGYYIYEDGEFKYINRCLTGEKTTGEDGHLPEKIRNEIYTFDGSLNNIYKDGKELKETYSIKFVNVKLEYNEERTELHKICDIEIVQDAKYGNIYEDDFEILPKGTILEDVIFEDWVC